MYPYSAFSELSERLRQQTQHFDTTADLFRRKSEWSRIMQERSTSAVFQYQEELRRIQNLSRSIQPFQPPQSMLSTTPSWIADCCKQYDSVQRLSEMARDTIQATQ